VSEKGKLTYATGVGQQLLQEPILRLRVVTPAL
jgi:hypothetical protein